jgi:uncharacterized repeat protein (TIGR03803 family)
MGIAYGLRKLLLAALLLFAGIALTAAPLGGAAAALSEQVLHSFCSQTNCTDGSHPYAGLIADGAGNLYGTSPDGCDFQFTPTDTGCTETVLCNGAVCPAPLGGLVMDAAGNLYGTNSGGGNYHAGTVFELTPNQNHTAWAQTTLYNFCSQSNCADGDSPYAGLIMDTAGNLYGTTNSGGAYERGTVFRLAPSANGWTQSVLYSFCPQGGSCPDGSLPQAGLVMDEAGNLYGRYGGNGSGVAFQLTLNEKTTTWTERVLHTFSDEPTAPLIVDGAGNLYGTTTGASGSGTVFRLSPGDPNWSYTLLHSFCQTFPCLDGAVPYAGVIMDAAGNLYGTTRYGGANRSTTLCPSPKVGCPTAFALTPNKDRSVWTETVLYSFCSQSSCTDGVQPNGGLLMDGAGNLFGTTVYGGNSACRAPGCGTVFTLSTGNFAVTVSETGNGKVTSSPAGIDCPTTCTASFAAGTQVSLTASPVNGWTFTGWGGTCSGAKSCTLTMNSSQRIAATFTQNLIHAVAVSVVGSSGGAVTSAPAGIDCGATSSASFAAGSQVTLTASPAKGWGFAGWGGACNGIGRCTLTLNASTGVSASFSTLFGGVAGPVVPGLNDAPALPPALIGPLPND